MDEIVESIFSKPPGEKSSIELQLEDVTAEIAERGFIEQFIFNILFLITYKGMKKLYGNDKEIITLTESEVELLKEYVRSYGYDMIIRGNNTDRDPWDIIKRGEQLLNYQLHFEKIY